MALADGRIPDAGDVFWIDFGSPVGHEQAGRRPSVVLSPLFYNERSSVFLTCPISRRERPWPFQVVIGPVGRIRGFALIDQVRPVDPSVRFCRFAGRVGEQTLVEIRMALASLFAVGRGPDP